MTTTQAPPAMRRARVEAVLVSVALAGNNSASYLLNVVAARLLVPALFGELSSLLAVLVIGVVPGDGVADRRGAAGGVRVVGPPCAGRPGARDQRIVATVAGLLAAPLLAALLHLASPWPALWLAAALGPLTLLGLFHGLLQGTRRFGLLAGLVALEGLGKIGGTLGGLLAGRSSAVALAGTAAGSLVVAGIGLAGVRRPRPDRCRGRDARRGAARHAGDAGAGAAGEPGPRAGAAHAARPRRGGVRGRRGRSRRSRTGCRRRSGCWCCRTWCTPTAGVGPCRWRWPCAVRSTECSCCGAAVLGGRRARPDRRGGVRGEHHAGVAVRAERVDAVAGADPVVRAAGASGGPPVGGLVWAAVLAEACWSRRGCTRSTTQVVTGALLSVTALAAAGAAVELSERTSYAPMHLRR